MYVWQNAGAPLLVILVSATHKLLLSVVSEFATLARHENNKTSRSEPQVTKNQTKLCPKPSHFTDLTHF
jgi:hypothetical protein